MKTPVIPAEEAARLAALRSACILDTPPEERFDRITRLASKIFDVPIALVSLVDADRQWFKSRVGLTATETPRDMSFCAHTILGADVMMVENATEDERFADNPLVTGDPSIRFYAGCPLTAGDGNRLGTLCLIDRQPRRLSDEQLAVLRDLAAIVSNEIGALELNEALTRQREIETRLHTLMDNVADGILMLDSACCIEAFNPAAEHTFGCTAQDVIGTYCGTLLSQDILDPKQVLREPGDSATIEVLCKRHDASNFPAEFSITAMQIDGERKYSLIVRDISRRKEAEAKLRTLDQARRKFFSTATHELRTPLASMAGFTELLLQREFDHATRQDLLSRIHRQTGEMLKLINGMLDLARVEAGEGEDFDIREQRIEPIIEQTVAELGGLNAQQRIRVDIPSGLPTVPCDAAKLRQALANIVGNSLKYASGDSEIVISACMDKRDRRVAMCLRVTDHGIGMTSEQLARIFERFYRANPDGSIPGTGLGMAIVKEIVEAHAGVVEVASMPGAGTEVAIRIPLRGPSLSSAEMKRS